MLKGGITMKVHLLGCNGWIPGRNETCCFLIEEKKSLIMLDAGTGVSNLSKFSDIVAKYDTISIVLSHYHLDHVVGLSYILPYVDTKKINIYGPGKPIYSKSTWQYLEELFQPAFFSRSLSKFANAVNCYDYGGENFIIDDITIKVQKQIHSMPSFRITIEDKLIYATDTDFSATNCEEYENGVTLLQECWEIDSNKKTKHTSLEALLAGLSDNIKKSTYLIHLNPLWDENDYNRIDTLINKTGIKLGRDGMTIII